MPGRHKSASPVERPAWSPYTASPCPCRYPVPENAKATRARSTPIRQIVKT